MGDGGAAGLTGAGSENETLILNFTLSTLFDPAELINAMTKFILFRLQVHFNDWLLTYNLNVMVCGFFHHDLMWQHCCSLFLLINYNKSLERGDARSAGIWTLADELVLVGGNCRWRGQKASTAPPTQYHDGGNCQVAAAADGWLEDNRNCCRSMHAPMTALLPQSCDCVCV